MSRVSLLTLSVFLGYVVTVRYVIVNPQPSHARTVAESIDREFRADYLVPALGDSSSCVEIISTRDADTIALQYVARPDCEAARKVHAILAGMARPGTHLYQLRHTGRYKLIGQTVALGPAPAYSPGFTVCLGNDTISLLLDPHDGLGYLPGSVMSSHRDTPIIPEQLLAHEIGHQACAPNPLRSDSDAVATENWLLFRRGGDQGIRMFHDVPGKIE